MFVDKNAKLSWEWARVIIFSTVLNYIQSCVHARLKITVELSSPASPTQ